MSKSTPAAPDYAAAAQAQADSSRDVTEQQTWANRPDQNTPFGSTSWENAPQWDPSTGQYLNRWTQNTTLNPQSQAALDSQLAVTRARSELAQNLTGRLGAEFGDQVNFDDFTPMAGVPDSSPEARQRAEDAIYQRMTSRLDPRFQQQENDTRTRLYNQGLREGDTAWDREIGNFDRQRDDAYQTAMNESIMGGGAESDRIFGQQMEGANYQNQLRQQQIAEMMQQRGFSLNEINAMLSGQQVGMPSMPSFSNAQRSEGVQALQAADLQGQHDLDAFNAQQAATQGMMSGAAGMFAFSDRRLKSQIKRIGSINGMPLYSYVIFGHQSVGVMSDEVDPALVIRHSSGFYMVDYGAIYGR